MRSLSVLVVLLGLLTRSGFAAGSNVAEAPFAVVGSRVTGKVTHVRLDWAVAALATAARLRVEWLGEPAHDAVSVTFDGHPVGAALGRLLGERNFALLPATATASGVGELWIGSDRGTRASVEDPSTSPPAAVANDPPRDEAGVLEPASLIASALHAGDPFERRYAIEQLAGVPEGTSTLVDALLADPSAEVRAAALQGLGAAPELSTTELARIAHRDPSPQVRFRAVALLHDRMPSDNEARQAAAVVARHDSSRQLQMAARAMIEGAGRE